MNICCFHTHLSEWMILQWKTCQKCLSGTTDTTLEVCESPLLSRQARPRFQLHAPQLRTCFKSCTSLATGSMQTISLVSAMLVFLVWAGLYPVHTQLGTLSMQKGPQQDIWFGNLCKVAGRKTEPSSTYTGLPLIDGPPWEAVGGCVDGYVAL